MIRLAKTSRHWFRWIGKSSETPLVSGFRQFGLKMAEILVTQGLQTNNPIQRNQCLRTTWISRPTEAFPRLVSCYVLR